VTGLQREHEEVLCEPLACLCFGAPSEIEAEEKLADDA